MRNFWCLASRHLGYSLGNFCEHMKTQFFNRTEAGQFLAENLGSYANRDDVLVLALPRGGVPVAAEVAKKLNAALDVFVVRKLGLPGHPELAMGAIASGGVCVFNGEVVNALRIPDEVIDAVSAGELIELQPRKSVSQPVCHHSTSKVKPSSWSMMASQRDRPCSRRFPRRDN